MHNEITVGQSLVNDAGGGGRNGAADTIGSLHDDTGCDSAGSRTTPAARRNAEKRSQQSSI